uniref:CCHC-type domain-containing protein n=1 Tax=Strongyloides venezuelensis TaxID=75913 RepID=A0A0K0FQ68_STRVS
MIRLERRCRSLAERLREQKRDFENTSDLIHTVHGWLKDKTKYGYQRDVKDINDVNVTCFNCKKKGHKKNQCKLLRKKPSFVDNNEDKPIVRRINTCTGKGIIVPISINQVNDLSAFVDPGSDVCLMAIDNVTKFDVKNIMLCKEQLKVGDDQEWSVIGTGRITFTLGKKDYTIKCRLMNNMNIIHPADILLGDDFLRKTKGYEVDYEKGTFKTIRGECVQLIRTQVGEEKELKNAIRRIAIVDEESARLEKIFKDDHDYVLSKNE